MIAIRLSVDRDQLEDFGDRDQGYRKDRDLLKINCSLTWVDRDQGVV